MEPSKLWMPISAWIVALETVPLTRIVVIMESVHLRLVYAYVLKSSKASFVRLQVLKSEYNFMLWDTYKRYYF
jgi:hypothetical protein